MQLNHSLGHFQHSYGFIQCCDRQARLFFHFSQFDGNIEHLKIGDPVEFEMTYDRRTGKPIASMVSKIAPEVVSFSFDSVKQSRKCQNKLSSFVGLKIWTSHLDKDLSTIKIGCLLHDLSTRSCQWKSYITYNNVQKCQ